MTKKDGKYIRSSLRMTFQEHEEIKEAARLCNLSIARYLIQLHHNNKAMKDSKKDPT